MPNDGRLRQALRDRLPMFAGWTSLGHPSVTEIFTKAGLDFIGIDMEHSTISQEQAQRIIAAAQAGGVGCLPRVASHNGEQIRRLLDSGADGILVPNVSSRREVEQIVTWCKYPPVGRRSYGVSRAHGYGFDFEEYTAAWNQRSVIIIQIETIEGVDAADSLLTDEAIDGAMVGPYDISGSLGLPGQLGHPRVQEACARVIEVCRRHGKACGTQVIEPTVARIEAAFDAGYTFIVLASDVFVLWKWSARMRELVSTLRRSLRRDVGRSGVRRRRARPRRRVAATSS